MEEQDQVLHYLRAFSIFGGKFGDAGPPDKISEGRPYCLSGSLLFFFFFFFFVQHWLEKLTVDNNFRVAIYKSTKTPLV
jgi:hypothetical protein